MADGIHTDPHVGTEPPLSALVGGIVQDAQKLIAQQIELVRHEIKEDVRTMAYAAAFLSVGAALCAISVILLCFAGVYVLHEVFNLPQWASFLIAGAIFLAVGGLLLYLAIHRVTTHNPLPDQSLAGLKENLQWKTTPK